MCLRVAGENGYDRPARGHIDAGGRSSHLRGCQRGPQWRQGRFTFRSRFVTRSRQESASFSSGRWSRRAVRANLYIGIRTPNGRRVARNCPRIWPHSASPPGATHATWRTCLFSRHTPGFGRADLVDTPRKDHRPAGAHLAGAPLLAALPFRICITTNYDHLFETALRDTAVAAGVRKDPLIVVYDPDRDVAERVPLDPDPQRPVVFKLHGDIDQPRSIVITEEDYISFIARMATSDSNSHPIHRNVRARLTEWPILFIGYSLRDYNLRLLFKTVRMGLDDSEFPLSFSVDPFADKVIVEVFQHGTQRLVDFCRRISGISCRSSTRPFMAMSTRSRAEARHEPWAFAVPRHRALQV